MARPSPNLLQGIDTVDLQRLFVHIDQLIVLQIRNIYDLVDIVKESPSITHPAPSVFHPAVISHITKSLPASGFKIVNFGGSIAHLRKKVHFYSNILFILQIRQPTGCNIELPILSYRDQHCASLLRVLIDFPISPSPRPPHISGRPIPEVLP